MNENETQNQSTKFPESKRRQCLWMIQGFCLRQLETLKRPEADPLTMAEAHEQLAKLVREEMKDQACSTQREDESQ